VVKAVKEKPLVYIDTREQKPFKLKSFRTEEKKLLCGDYCLAEIPEICIERKASVSELYGNFTKGRDCFFRELDRAQDNSVQLIILTEFSMVDFHKKSRYHRSNPLLMVNTISSIWLEYKVHTVFAGTRSNAQWWTNTFFTYILKRQKDGK